MSLVKFNSWLFLYIHGSVTYPGLLPIDTKIPYGSTKLSLVVNIEFQLFQGDLAIAGRVGDINKIYTPAIRDVFINSMSEHLGDEISPKRD